MTLKDGVSPSKLYLPAMANPPDSLLDFLCQKFVHIDKATWQQRFVHGLITLSDGMVLDESSPYLAGQTLYYYRHMADEVVVPFEHKIIFENDELMVVDKPHFLTVSPAGRYVQQTLLTRLKHETNNEHLSPIHRLDKDTAGLILISKNPTTRHLYQSLFARQAVHKTYHAIAPSTNLPMPQTLTLHVERGEPFYTMRVNPDKRANSHTIIKVLDEQDNWSKYELTPTTGKLHQLRLHMAYLGLPIKNDPFYPQVCHLAPDDFSRPLQLLAYRLALTDPVTGEDFMWTSSLRLVW